MNANDIWLIAGLGNPESKYDGTRHNAGFAALDHLAGKWDIAVSKTKFQGLWGQGEVDGHKVVLLKPLTYMNLSGNAVRYWLQKLPVTQERLIVICDDINLPFGTLRMRKNGSDGGHNGLKNIAETLGSTDYVRIRMGVGHDFSRGAQVDYVLGNLSEEESSQMPELCKSVIQGVNDWIFAGADRAMNVLNAKKVSK